MTLAPETLQCMPARLSRVPIATLHPGLQDARGGAQILRMELWIAHATAVANNVGGAFSRFVGETDIRPERSDDGLQLSIVQLGTARCGPRFGFRVGCAKDRLSGPVQSFFGMEPVQDLDGLRKQFRDGIPNPARTIAESCASGCLGEASPRGFPQHAFGEVGSFEAGVRGGGTFDGGRIGGLPQFWWNLMVSWRWRLPG